MFQNKGFNRENFTLYIDRILYDGFNAVLFKRD